MEMKTILALSKAGVDTEGALRRFAGNSILYERFLVKFLEDETFKRIEDALSRTDWSELIIAAHTLKGISANMGMDRLSTSCSKLVAQLRAEDHSGVAKEWPELQAAYREICELLSE